MTLISDTDTLNKLCLSLRDDPYIAIDTEFMRERTYYPKLCLVQIGGSVGSSAIDPLAEGLDLSPLFELLAVPSITKVFHAARQDLEIFYHLTGSIPAPLFDTQVAAMVCGFGDSVSYDKLVAKITKQQIDKTSRYTDWSNRPLTDRQIDYALSDVIYLQPCYEYLRDNLEKTNRETWVEEEMEILNNPKTYAPDPYEMWRRVKIRSRKPKFLSVLRELAALRELEAQRRDVPRNRVFRDDALIDLAGSAPKTAADLGKTRGFSSQNAGGKFGEAILKAINKGLSTPNDQAPSFPEKPDIPNGRSPLIDLLKVLLKKKAEDHGVAQKLIANSDDLDLIAAGRMEGVAALSGWRREIFGQDALALKDGKIALSAKNGAVSIFQTD